MSIRRIRDTYILFNRDGLPVVVLRPMDNGAWRVVAGRAELIGTEYATPAALVAAML